MFVVTACSSSVPQRTEVLDELAGQQIIPAYENFEAKANVLARAVGELCEQPTAKTLAAANDALADSRWMWSYTEAMWVGPVMERRAWATIDWPIDSAEIEELITDASLTLDQERLSRRIGADQRGLGAVEYVLDTIDSNGESTERRCQYLTGIVEVMAREASLLSDDWSVSFEEGEPYRSAFSDVDGAGLDSLVNDSLFLLEAVADAELGRALGVMEQPADPGIIVEGPSGLGVADIAAHLSGLTAVYLGGPESAGLTPLFGDELTARLTDQLAAAELAVSALSGPLGDELVDRPEAVAEARAAIKAVQTTVATEVVATLGVTIGFSDADGDSG